MDTKTQFNEYFDRAYKDKVGNEFENWFAKMASYVFGTDFERVKPGGPKGDMKCDGYNKATETVYQCYAPEGGKGNFARKINDSFPKVVSFWPDMKGWVFVTNSKDGMPTSATDVIQGLEKKYPGIKFSKLTREQLKAQFHDKLSPAQLDDVYPESYGKIGDVKLEHIKPLIDKIISEAGEELGSEAFGEIPSSAKIDFNEFSGKSKRRIQSGLVKSGIVENYINSFSKPEQATKMQNAMKEKYEDLVGRAYKPDDVLQELIQWIAPSSYDDSRDAAMVIIAHFFESCDIFRNPPASGDKNVNAN